MSSYSMSLAVIVLLAATAHVQAQTPLSDWISGVATNYGGSSEGADANAASYGTLEVSLFSIPYSLLHSPSNKP